MNYELPNNAEAYVHRVGRTGRAGRAGLAISLAAPHEVSKLDAIEERVGITFERLSPRSSDTDIDALETGFAREAKMDTILIAGGRKDKVRPGDILGALTGEAGGLAAAEVGKIEIHDRFSYVAVATHVSRNAVKSLSRGRIKGRRFRATLIVSPNAKVDRQ